MAQGNGFFQDQDGNFSSGRLVAFIAVCTGVFSILTAIALGTIALLMNRQTPLPQALVVAGPTLISVGLGFQGWHKMSETGQVKARFEAEGTAGGGQGFSMPLAQGGLVQNASTQGAGGK